jgi:hypothetical protein
MSLNAVAKDEEKKIDLDKIENVISKINKPSNNRKTKYKFKSLMFSNSEMANIKKILNSKEKPKEKEDKKEDKKIDNTREIRTFGKIYLSSILYLSKDAWSIWINNKKISSTNNSELNEIYINSVSPDKIGITWSLNPRKWRIISDLPQNTATPKLNKSGQVEIKFTLKSNQTYILKYDKVVNGKI